MITNNDYDAELDGLLADMFMKHLTITLSGNQIYSGQLLLFKHKNYEYILTMVSDATNHREKVSIPYPFEYWALNKGGRLVFDYRILTLLHNDPELLEVFKRVRKPNKSKFFDTLLEIVIT